MVKQHLIRLSDVDSKKIKKFATENDMSMNEFFVNSAKSYLKENKAGNDVLVLIQSVYRLEQSVKEQQKTVKKQEVLLAKLLEVFETMKVIGDKSYAEILEQKELSAMSTAILGQLTTKAQQEEAMKLYLAKKEAKGNGR